MEISKSADSDSMAIAASVSDFSESDIGLMITRKRDDKSRPGITYESNPHVILRHNLRYVGEENTAEEFGEQAAAMVVLNLEYFHNFVNSKLS